MSQELWSIAGHMTLHSVPPDTGKRAPP